LRLSTFHFPLSTFHFPTFHFPTFYFPTFYFPTFYFPTFYFPTFYFPPFYFPTFSFLPSHLSLPPMPRLAAFPKAYMQALCRDGTMTVSQWIALAAPLEVEGLEWYAGFLEMAEEKNWSRF